MVTLKTTPISGREFRSDGRRQESTVSPYPRRPGEYRDVGKGPKSLRGKRQSRLRKEV